MTTIEEIYRAYFDDVYRFALWLCGDVTEAEDIVSETFPRLWGSFEDLQVATVKAYLLTIARNVFVSQRRRTGRYRQLQREYRTLLRRRIWRRKAKTKSEL
jgi:DNA-directed RNA polymerase specialized sigma24 family protein